MTVGTRHDFGRDWNEVVNNWCLGLPLPVSAKEAWEALGVLEHLWPKYLGEVLTRNQRGAFVMAYVIDDGLTLLACRNLDGFDSVLHRIKDKEQSALAEARFASTLVNLGYHPVLDTPHKNGTHPDALILSDNQEVFIDVILPERSDQMKYLSAIGETLVHKFLEKLSATFTNKRLEIFALSPDLMSMREDIYRFLDESGNLVADKIYEIPGIALIKLNDGNAQIELNQLIQVDPDPLVMGFASTNQTGNTVVLRLSSADERLQRMMNDKSPQFSQEEANLFVIDLSFIPYGFKNWPALVRRRLQTERNRRFSGVLLLHRYLDNATRSFILNSHLEEHPNPYKKLPASLLNDLDKT